jgi:arylsulfatase A-like enzyme
VNQRLTDHRAMIPFLKSCFRLLPAALLFAPLAISRAESTAANSPNVILILTDDQGYGDIAAHGNPILKTPHLDKLHAESVRLTDFHVDPTCAPTRAALLTGKYPHSVRVWHTIAGGNHLRDGEMTMADSFRTNGYRTAIFGKWHLGSNLPYRPIDRGFDEWLGQGDGGTGTTDDHFLNDRVNDHYLHNGEWKQITGWAPEVFYHSAYQYIRDRKKDQKPFFIYLPTYLPHNPHTLPDPAWADGYRGKVDEPTAFFFAAIEKIDGLIGKLRATLSEQGLERDTIIIFMTDNGGTGGVDVFNAGMRGKKGDIHDGGHRVPFFIHWPGGKLRHGEDLATLNAHIDVLPTLVDLCGLKLAPASEFHGRSFRAQLLDRAAETPERTLFIERQRTFKPQKWGGGVAMTPRWRLVNNDALYDIKNDPAQKHNVLAEHPEVAAKLRQEFDVYWSKVTPGDRDRAVSIVGDERDPETFLHASDWYLPQVPWNHAQVAAGPPAAGDWRIRAARAGNYRFEVRRWPREADAPLAGAPSIQKTVDAWDAGGPKPDLIYGGKNTRFKRLSVAAVRLTVGETTRTLAVAAEAKDVSFDLVLEKDRTLPVKAELLDASGKLLAGGYYVYCRLIAP